MADRLKAAAERLAARQRAHAGRAVTYSRGALSVPLTATVGRTADRAEAAEGKRRVEAATRDYLIPAADLVLGGERVTPKLGDRVTDADGSWDVVTEFDGRHWRPGDPYGVRLRVHTKQVA